jgi:NodT family efflux transporter outer membrane factor (OMF) lipoprotein
VARRNARRAGALAAGFILAGCAVGPDYKKPQAWSPAQWQKAATQERSSALSVPTELEPDVQWWAVFHDPELTSLEQRLAAQNLDVLRASEQLAVSRGQLLLAGAERFPDLAASGSYSRVQHSSRQLQRIVERIGSKSPGLIPDSAAVGDATIPLLNNWQDGVQASWEVDLWGRVRRQYEAAKSYTNATMEERRGILIARQSELASDYMTLRSLQEQLRITTANRDAAAKLLQLSQSRYKSGLVSELDVDSAQSELQHTNALIPQFEQRIAMQINAINLLMGMPPGGLNTELVQTAGIPLVPPAVPIGLPSELAHRRPDIREAEAELHAATAEVGQAMADFYPKVTIDAGFGLQSFSFRDMGMWSSRMWNVGPSITIPIFQGGRLTGQLQMKKASQRAAALRYRKTVLNAWSEVDNALTAYQAEQKKNQRLSSQVAADKRSMELAQSQYKHGLQSYLQVLDAQRRLLSSQTSLADSTASIADDLVRLYNALGGGWESTFPVSKPKHA